MLKKESSIERETQDGTDRQTAAALRWMIFNAWFVPLNVLFLAREGD
jgi:hypothetical protein